MAQFHMYMASAATGARLTGLSLIEAETFADARSAYRAERMARDPKLDLRSVELLAEVR